MSRIQTPVTGISTTSAYEDGSCYSLVNLRPKNSAMHPVAPRKVMQELPRNYDIIFVHQNNDYKNWIGVINDGSYSSVHWNIFGEITFYVTGATNIKVGDIYQIQAGGDVKIRNVDIYSGSGTILVSYESDSSNLDKPEYSGTLTLKSGSGQRNIDYSTAYYASSSIIQSEERGKIHSIQQIGNTLSLVTSDKIYYLLFQNGNYTSLGEIPSLPAIGFKTSDEMVHAKLYFTSEYDSGTIKPDNFIDATKGLVNKAINTLRDGWTDESGEWHDGSLFLFDAHFVRYAFRLFDGTLTKHSPPILIMPVRHIVGTHEGEQEDLDVLDSIKTISYDFDSTLRNESCVDVYGYLMHMFYDFKYLGDSSSDDWKDIIKSVDIFMSAPLGLSSIENIRTDMPTSDSPRTLNYNLIKGMPPEAFKNVENTSLFYFVRSIELGEEATVLKRDEFPSSDSDIGKMENLIFQEVMSDDSFSNHTYGADISYAYNNRLHLAGIKTTFSKGYQPDFFMWFNDADNPASYNGFKRGDARGEKFAALLIETEIQVGAAIEKVYSVSSWLFNNIYKMFLSAFISYPDPRAKKMTVYRRDNSAKWTKVFSCPLRPHSLLSIAFFANDGLKPITEDSDATPLSELPDIFKTVTLPEPNKIKVSELNNPIVFPVRNTYQVSEGAILNMATNAMNVSDRNYGQYPLYVFTTQGIWNLNVGSGEVVYTSQSAPTYTEAPASPVVCSTPFGVVFTTQRGLHMINGQSVDFISPQLEQDYLRVNMELPDSHCKDVVHLFNDKSFSDYLRGIENIIYNPHESEIIICDKDSQYNYVLNLPSQSFYKSTERIDLMVGNTFPQLLVMGGNQLKDFATFNTPGTHICLVMRPLTFGTPDIKNLERIILRALLMDIQNVSDKKSIILVHDSNDGINFRLSRGIPTDPCSRRDFDMGLFASSKSRQFMFSFAGIVDESSRINFLDTQIRQEYNNTKMR